ncbi:MAG: hypothetical protein ACR2GD_05805 [Pyrinomonadaceae bacterium]
MQDIQNIPNPDVNSTVNDEDFGNHSGVEQEREDNDVENIPLPPDEKKRAPIEEPPDTEKPPIDEDNPRPKQIV